MYVCMGKLTLNCPSLQSLICNLPDFGRHVTSPNQGLPSLASWGVKRRDPGNEVGLLAVRFSLEVCAASQSLLVHTPIFARARGFKHSTDLKRKGGLQAVYLDPSGGWTRFACCFDPKSSCKKDPFVFLINFVCFHS